MSRPERDLDRLFVKLQVFRHEGLWVYDMTSDDAPLPGRIFQFREREGWSQLRPALAEDQLEDRWVWLELSVHSDLHAVGFMARISAALTAAGVPCNVVSALNHDHLFVPEALCERAMVTLSALRTEG